MKSKFILLTFLAGLFGSNAFCMDRNIAPPNFEEGYNGRSSLGVWRLKKPDLYEKKGIKPGEPLYPYHAWIKHEDKDNLPLHVIYYTLDENKKAKTLVSFVCDKDENGALIDPKQYSFERTTEVQYLIKDPYIDDKKNKITGKKFDVWNLQGTPKEKQIKFWDPMPDNVPVNRFPGIFKFQGEVFL